MEFAIFEWLNRQTDYSLSKNLLRIFVLLMNNVIFVMYGIVFVLLLGSTNEKMLLFGWIMFLEPDEVMHTHTNYGSNYIYTICFVYNNNNSQRNVHGISIDLRLNKCSVFCLFCFVFILFIFLARDVLRFEMTRNHSVYIKYN